MVLNLVIANNRGRKHYAFGYELVPRTELQSVTEETHSSDWKLDVLYVYRR